MIRKMMIRKYRYSLRSPKYECVIRNCAAPCIATKVIVNLDTSWTSTQTHIHIQNENLSAWHVMEIENTIHDHELFNISVRRKSGHYYNFFQSVMQHSFQQNTTIVSAQVKTHPWRDLSMNDPVETFIPPTYLWRRRGKKGTGNLSTVIQCGLQFVLHTTKELPWSSVNLLTPITNYCERINESFGKWQFSPDTHTFSNTLETTLTIAL